MRLFLCLFALAAAAIAAALFVPHTPADLQALAGRSGPVVGVAFVAAGALLTAAMFPGTILAAAAGMLFGPALGGVLALAAQTLGGVTAAMAARTGARSSIERIAGKRLRRISRVSAETGTLGVAAIRCAPGMPATALHYVLGVSRTPLRAIAMGLTLGAAPRIGAYALIGGGLSHVTSGAGLAGLVLLASTTVASAVWVVQRRRRTRAIG